jgi:hypothetical protein
MTEKRQCIQSTRKSKGCVLEGQPRGAWLYQKVPGLALQRANRWQHWVALAAIVTFNLEKAVCQETSGVVILVFL